MIKNPEKRRKIRVLLSKSKMDVHDRGLRYVARKMVESGFEVILTRHGLIDEVARIALEEDVDVIGLSFSVGGHLSATSRLWQILREKGLQDKMLIVGGVIPDDDISAIQENGVKGVFGAGSSADDAINCIKSNFLG